MRKLVFGIIAVVLLQVAFYSYVAINTPSEEVTSVGKRSEPIAKSPELSRVESPRSALPPEPNQQPEADSKIAHAKAPEKPAVATRVVSTAHPAVEQKSTKRDYIYSREQFPLRHIARAKTSPAVPSGYTMVLVDYTKGGIPVTYGKRRIRAASANGQAYASRNPEPRSSEVSKPDRKRPFLARAFPAMVKKPWKWMKSLASKLN